MKQEFAFAKYQACGNDFILRDEMDCAATPDTERGKLARILCERHFQVGADGILFVESTDLADGSMRLFEPDGREADMCGNGLRCVATHLCTKLGEHEVDILTKDGIKHVSRAAGKYRAEMGPVRTDLRSLRRYLAAKGLQTRAGAKLEISVAGRLVTGFMLNSGEPHLVLFTENVLGDDVRGLGGSLSKKKSVFPRATNVDFVEVVGLHKIGIRTYERGVFDETLSCGTGATASAAASLLLGKVKPGPVEVKTMGGTMTIEMTKEGLAFMTGPAVKVFDGSLVIDL